MTDDTRDRVIRLEERFESLASQSEKAFRKIDHIYDLVLQGKGAARLIWIGAAGLGGLATYVASKAPTIAAWIGSFPR